MRKVGIRYWWPLWALLAVMAASVGLACDGGDGTERTVIVRVSTPTATPVSMPTATPTPGPTRTPTPGPNVCGFGLDAAPASVLQVQEPQPDERVKTPFHVRGWGSEIAKDNRGVMVALVDAAGNTLPLKEVRPGSRAGRIAPPGLTVTDFTAPFATDMLVEGLTVAAPYCLLVFLELADGTPKQVVQVPITVAP